MSDRDALRQCAEALRRIEAMTNDPMAEDEASLWRVIIDAHASAETALDHPSVLAALSGPPPPSREQVTLVRAHVKQCRCDDGVGLWADTTPTVDPHCEALRAVLTAPRDAKARDMVVQLSDHACDGCWQDIARLAADDTKWTEIAAKLAERLPAIKASVEAIEKAKHVRPDLLNRQITI